VVRQRGVVLCQDARRTFVTLALDAGATYPQLAAVTGHARVDMVARYSNSPCGSSLCKVLKNMRISGRPVVCEELVPAYEATQQST